MRIAIPIWRGCVSPLFEAAGCLLVLRLVNDTELERKRIHLADQPPAARAQLLWLERIEVLICGALSRPVQRMLEANGVKVLGWVKGTVEEVLAAFLEGRLDDPRYQLPGCRRRGRKGPGRRQGGHRKRKRGGH